MNHTIQFAFEIIVSHHEKQEFEVRNKQSRTSKQVPTRDCLRSLSYIILRICLRETYAPSRIAYAWMMWVPPQSKFHHLEKNVAHLDSFKVLQTFPGTNKLTTNLSNKPHLRSFHCQYIRKTSPILSWLYSRYSMIFPLKSERISTRPSSRPSVVYFGTSLQIPVWADSDSPAHSLPPHWPLVGSPTWPRSPRPSAG